MSPKTDAAMMMIRRLRFCLATCGRGTSMAETLEVKPLGRTIVVSTFASELFDIATLSVLQRSDRTNQMHQRARAVQNRQGCCHYDNAEQGGLASETAARFIL